MIQKYDTQNLDLKNKRLKIVQEYLTTNITQSELKNKYQIGMASSIPQWINQFNIELYNLGFKQEITDKRKLNSNKHTNLKLLKIVEGNKEIMYIPNFTKKERYTIIEDYLSSNISQSELSRKYKIKWRAHISRWIHNIQNELNLKTNSESYQLNSKDLNMLKLLEKYNKNKKTVRKFSDEFKQNITNEYIKNKVSYRDLAKKHGLNERLISSWVQVYKNKTQPLNDIQNQQKNADDILINHDTRNDENQIKNLKIEIEKLKLENKQKSEALEYETLKSNAFSTLIDVAEKELKISIRKKFDVKQ